MAEYIEREAFIKRFCERCNEEMSESPCEPSDCFAREVIKTFPAVDVATVQHGRWIASHDEFYSCSICKYPVYVGWNQTKYCPNCGAKMDGGGGNSDMA